MEHVKLCEEGLRMKNPNITEEDATRICRMLNNLSTVPPNRENIPELFENILDLWFLDNSIFEEIFKKMNTSELCFLHEISFDVRPLSEYIENFSLRYYLKAHLGKETGDIYQLDFTKYFNNQIKPCTSNLIAIPFSISFFKF